MEIKIYKGIAYTLLRLEKNRWQWAIKPPLSVRGLEPLIGIAMGTANEAAQIAKAQIDLQIEQIERQRDREIGS